MLYCALTEWTIYARSLEDPSRWLWPGNSPLYCVGPVKRAKTPQACAVSVYIPSRIYSGLHQASGLAIVQVFSG